MPEDNGAFRTSVYVYSCSWNWDLGPLNEFEINALKNDLLKFAEHSESAATRLIGEAVHSHTEAAMESGRVDPNVLVLYGMFAPAMANGGRQESAILNEMLSVLQFASTDHPFAQKGAVYAGVARALQSVHERMDKDNVLPFPKRPEQRAAIPMRAAVGAPVFPYRLVVGAGKG